MEYTLDASSIARLNGFLEERSLATAYGNFRTADIIAHQVADFISDCLMEVNKHKQRACLNAECNKHGLYTWDGPDGRKAYGCRDHAPAVVVAITDAKDDMDDDDDFTHEVLEPSPAAAARRVRAISNRNK